MEYSGANDALLLVLHRSFAPVPRYIEMACSVRKERITSGSIASHELRYGLADGHRSVVAESLLTNSNGGGIDGGKCRGGPRNDDGSGNGERADCGSLWRRRYLFVSSVPLADSTQEKLCHGGAILVEADVEQYNLES